MDENIQKSDIEANQEIFYRGYNQNHTHEEYQKKLNFLEFKAKEIDFFLRIAIGLRLTNLVSLPDKSEDQVLEFEVLNKKYHAPKLSSLKNSFSYECPNCSGNKEDEKFWRVLP